MNTKKKTILAAAFVVAIIALAGVGYAAFSAQYQGTTTAATDSFDVDYVIVSLDGDAYQSKTTQLYVEYNTDTVYENSSVVTKYYWIGSSAVTHDVTVSVPANDDATDDPDYFTVTAKITAAAPTGYCYQYKINSGTWTYAGTAANTTVELDTNVHTVSDGKVGDWDAQPVSWRIVPLNSGGSAGISTDDTSDGVLVENATLLSNITTPTLTLPTIEYKVVANQTSS